MVSEKVMCPVCESDALETLCSANLPLKGGRELQSRIYECTTCTHRFLRTSGSQHHAIEKKYDEEYAGFRVDPFFARRIREAVERDLVSRQAPPARILDVGCGNGEFMKAASEAGYQVEGIDVSEDAAALCRERGLQAVSGDFLTYGLMGPYDIITMWDVVEHLQQPGAFIARAYELLAPGGYLILKIPGFGRLSFAPVALDSRFAGAILGAPGHVQYFNPASLQTLLTRHAFSSVDWLEHQAFRKRPPARSVRQVVGRLVAQSVNQLAGSRNLYVAAVK